MLCLRIIVLLTLCTLLNAIVCCLQLNTERGTDVNLKVDYLGTDACWIAVCVSCCNAQVNLILIIIVMYMHCGAFSICQLPAVICLPNMLVIFYGETPIVNCGPRSFLLHLKYKLVLLLSYFTLCNSSSSTLYI